jgi:hypothetical protein
MTHAQLDVYGATNAEIPDLKRELSNIFGAPADNDDETLSGLSSAISFFVEVVNPNLPVLAGMIVALVRTRRQKTIIQGPAGRIEIDGETSVEEVKALWEKVFGPPPASS